MKCILCMHVQMYIHECVMQISLKMLHLHIFGTSFVPMDFYTLQNFIGFLDFGLKLSE